MHFDISARAVQTLAPFFLYKVRALSKRIRGMHLVPPILRCPAMKSSAASSHDACGGLSETGMGGVETGMGGPEAGLFTIRGRVPSAVVRLRLVVFASFVRRILGAVVFHHNGSIDD